MAEVFRKVLADITKISVRRITKHHDAIRKQILDKFQFTKELLNVSLYGENLFFNFCILSDKFVEGPLCGECFHDTTFYDLALWCYSALNTAERPCVRKIKRTMKKFVLVVFNLFCSTSLFSCGTAMMDYFLVYPSRAIVGENEFVEYHDLLEQAILPVSVLPFLIMTILNGILLWRRPEGASRILIVISFICLLADWASSIFIQIPINLELNNGKDLVLIQQVMDTNWGRIILESAQAVIVFCLMLGVTSNAISMKESMGE